MVARARWVLRRAAKTVEDRLSKATHQAGGPGGTGSGAAGIKVLVSRIAMLVKGTTAGALTWPARVEATVLRMKASLGVGP